MNFEEEELRGFIGMELGLDNEEHYVVQQLQMGKIINDDTLYPDLMMAEADGRCCLLRIRHDKS